MRRDIIFIGLAFLALATFISIGTSQIELWRSGNGEMLQPISSDNEIYPNKSFETYKLILDHRGTEEFDIKNHGFGSFNFHWRKDRDFKSMELQFFINDSERDNCSGDSWESNIFNIKQSDSLSLVMNCTNLKGGVAYVALRKAAEEQPAQLEISQYVTLSPESGVGEDVESISGEEITEDQSEMYAIQDFDRIIFVDQEYMDFPRRGMYKTIQKAIDQTNGEPVTIIVRKGNYRENLIIIDKPNIRLMGETDETIITPDSSRSAILIKSKNISISNFTIEGGNIGIDIAAEPLDTVRIVGNKLLNSSGIGINISGSRSKSSLISNNIIYRPGSDGIVISEAMYLKIDNNSIIRPGAAAITLYDSDRNFILNSSIDAFNNPNYHIYLENSSENILNNNSGIYSGANKPAIIYICCGERNEIINVTCSAIDSNKCPCGGHSLCK